MTRTTDAATTATNGDTNNADAARTIQADFREAFDAGGGYDLVESEDIPFCLVSEDNTITLVNREEIDSVGITDLEDYRDVDATLRPATCRYTNKEHDVEVYVLDIEDGENRAVYDGGRIEAISEFLEQDVEHFDVSIWSTAPSDVYLLRIDVEGTPWSLILAPRVPEWDDMVILEDNDVDVDRGRGLATDGGEDVDRLPAERFPGSTYEEGGFAWVDPRGLPGHHSDSALASQGVTITDVREDELTVEYPRSWETQTAELPVEYVRDTDLEEDERVTFVYDSVYSDEPVEKTGKVHQVHRTRGEGFAGIYVDVDGTRYQIRATGGVKTYGPVERAGGDSTVRRIGSDAVVTRAETDEDDADEVERQAAEWAQDVADEADEELVTDGGRTSYKYDHVELPPVAKGDRVRVSYVSGQSGTEQTREGPVTEVCVNGFRFDHGGDDALETSVRDHENPFNDGSIRDVSTVKRKSDTEDFYHVAGLNRGASGNRSIEATLVELLDDVDRGRGVETDGGSDLDDHPERRLEDSTAYCGEPTLVEGKLVECEKAPGHADDHAGKIPDEDTPGLLWDLHEWSTDDEDEPELVTDGGQDLEEDRSATDAARHMLAEHRDVDPETISDETVYETFEHDMTDATGDLIVRYVGDRNPDDGAYFKISDGAIFKDGYAPDRILAERFGLEDAIETALAELEVYADLRRVKNGTRHGAFTVSEDGEITDVSIHFLGISEGALETARSVIVQTANDALGGE